MKKKVISALLCVAMVSSMLIGCGSKTEPAETPAETEAEAEAPAEAPAEEASAEGGSVYYLNFKPEQADQWVALAEKYTEETGVQVDVVTAASGTYESTLKSEIAKTDAPTLFQVNGPVGLATWKDYCYDLSGSELYKNVKSDDFVLKDGDAVKGIAYVIETYGIIYNKSIMADYLTKDYAVVSDVSEINSFEQLKAVAESIQANKEDLGVEGAFTSAGMDSSSDWRFKTHLANLPIYYEYEGNGYSSVEAIQGTYLDNYHQIWDLYINNATCAPTLLSSKTGDEAEAEFALGEAVFFQNGTWEYGNLINAGMTDDDLGMLPIYIGVDGEENQGLCTGSENYWCVNSQASEADIQATLDFLAWVITSDEGRNAMANEMGFLTPFSTFDDGYVAENALIAAADEYIAAGKKSVAWCFPTMPSETWKNGVGSALTEYAAGTGNWDAVVTAFVDGWAAEYEAANN
ncbi:MAG: ABC transporter substrate-binding protein [Lachnospiraceae bacterium]|nr:ABC transporter substrate-binding protein [Lachnospiraceae bacterium]